jgi:ragulator complex protein LAMTOR3
MKTSLITTFTMATDQASKLGLGNNKTCICMYSKHVIVQFNKLPTLVVTFIGTENCNIGQILALDDQIDAYLEDLKLIVE